MIFDFKNKILRTIYEDEDDDTHASLIYANRTSVNSVTIIILNHLKGGYSSTRWDQSFWSWSKNRGVFLNWQGLSYFPPIMTNYSKIKHEQEWQGLVGYVNKDLLADKMPKPSSETLIGFCGPPVMGKIVTEFLKELGHQEDDIFTF